MNFDPIKAGNFKNQEIDKLLEAFEKVLTEASQLLNQQLLDSFLSKLDVSNGLVLTNEQNLRKIALIDRTYKAFQEQTEVKVITEMLTHMDEIMLLNDQYFSSLMGGRKIDSQDIKSVIRSRLGISADGELIRSGYMMGLLDDPAVRNEIRNFATSRVIGGAGFQDFRAGLKDLVAGDPDRLGVFQRFYRNYAFDTYSQVDAMNGKLYAEKLGLKYFIYNGGIMRDKKGKVRSRTFCVKRAGKVFSSKEAAKWKTDKDLTAVDDKNTYSWEIQRGGFACRHSIDYISEELALELRPELAKQDQEEKEPAQVEPVEVEKPKGKKLRDPKLAFDQIPDLEILDAEKELPGFKDLLKKAADDTSSAETFKAMADLEDQIAKQVRRKDLYLKMKYKTTDKVLIDQLEKINSLQDEWLKLKQKNPVDYNAQARELLKQKEQSAITVSNPYKKKKGYEVLNANFESALDFYKGFVGKGVNDAEVLTIQARKGVRAFYRNNDKLLMLDKAEKAQTIVHELAHNTEYASNWILKRSVDFLKKRATSPDPIYFKRLEKYKNWGFRADEKFLEDKFYNDYCGKWYEGSYGRNYLKHVATEIVSMGMDRMYQDPIAFYNEDKEYFNFILSLFRE